MLTFWIFHESNISVMISHFLKNDIYDSNIVEITGRRTWQQNWKQPFDCKLVYILGKTVQDMVLDRFLRQITSDFVLKFLMLLLKSREIFPSVSVANFEHCFFWLGRLWAKLHNCNLLSYKNENPPETSLGFSAEPIRTRVNDIQVK